MMNRFALLFALGCNSTGVYLPDGDVPTEETVTRLLLRSTEPVVVHSVSPNARWLIAEAADLGLQLVDTSQGTRRALSLPSGLSYQVADGGDAVVVTGPDLDSTIRVWKNDALWDTGVVGPAFVHPSGEVILVPGSNPLAIHVQDEEMQPLYGSARLGANFCYETLDSRSYWHPSSGGRHEVERCDLVTDEFAMYRSNGRLLLQSADGTLSDLGDSEGRLSLEYTQGRVWIEDGDDRLRAYQNGVMREFPDYREPVYGSQPSSAFVVESWDNRFAIYWEDGSVEELLVPTDSLFLHHTGAAAFIGEDDQRYVGTLRNPDHVGVVDGFNPRNQEGLVWNVDGEWFAWLDDESTSLTTTGELLDLDRRLVWTDEDTLNSTAWTLGPYDQIDDVFEGDLGFVALTKTDEFHELTFVPSGYSQW